MVIMGILLSFTTIIITTITIIIQETDRIRLTIITRAVTITGGIVPQRGRPQELVHPLVAPQHGPLPEQEDRLPHVSQIHGQANQLLHQTDSQAILILSSPGQVQVEHTMVGAREEAEVIVEVEGLAEDPEAAVVEADGKLKLFLI
jgi:hypothetical protein